MAPLQLSSRQTLSFPAQRVIRDVCEIWYQSVEVKAQACLMRQPHIRVDKKTPLERRTTKTEFFTFMTHTLDNS